MTAKSQTKTTPPGYATIPVAAIKRLLKELPADGDPDLRTAVADVYDYLPDKQAALDEAVKQLELLEYHIFFFAADSDAFLAGLLYEKVGFAVAGHRRKKSLLQIAQFCATWTDERYGTTNSGEAILKKAKSLDLTQWDEQQIAEELSERAAKIPLIIRIGMAPKGIAVNLGAFALAWAAELIEEGE